MKKLLKSITAGALALGLAVAINPTFIAIDKNSTAAVGFEASDVPEFIDQNPGGTAVFAPSFDFGPDNVIDRSKMITLTDVTLPTNGEKKVLVTDDTEDPMGWTLKATLGIFQGGGITLEDIVLRLLGGAITAQGPVSEASSIAAGDPTVHEDSTVAGQLSFAADGTTTVDIVTADEPLDAPPTPAQGIGLWKLFWLNNQAKLDVPAKSQEAGSFTAIFVWTLAATP